MDHSHPKESVGRRDLLAALGSVATATSARLVVPALWATPIIAATELPAHAECSAGCIIEAKKPPYNHVQENDGATMSFAREGAELVITLTPPTRILQERLQYYVWVNVGDGLDTVILATLQPGPNDQSRTVVLRTSALPAGPVKQFELRWDGGYTKTFTTTD